MVLVWKLSGTAVLEDYCRALTARTDDCVLGEKWHPSCVPVECHLHFHQVRPPSDDVDTAKQLLSHTSRNLAR